MTDNPSHFTQADASERGKSGHARMRAIAEDLKSATEPVVRAMLLGLNRTATPLEELQAQAIAGLYLRAARKREMGRSDLEELREAALLQQSSVFAYRHPATEQPE